MAPPSPTRWQRCRRELRQERRAYGLAALSGGLYALGFCGFDQWYLAWVCMVPVLWALDRPGLPLGLALRLGWVSGMGAHLGCYTWIIYMLRHFAYLPLPLALVGYSLLCLAQSSLFAAWAWATAALRQRCGVALLWAAPVSMVVAEWLYPAIFPSYIANSQYRHPIVLQGVELWGTLGLSFLLLLCSSMLQTVLAALLRRQPLSWRQALGVGLACLACGGNLVYGRVRLHQLDAQLQAAPQRIKVGLVQTNMGIYEKTDNPAEGLRRHRDQSLELEAQGAELIIWPESGYYYGIAEGTREVQREVLGPLRTPLLFGGLRLAQRGPERRLYNTAFLTDQQGSILGSYDKTFLLAFGEYLPLGGVLPFLYQLSPQTSHFSRGEHLQPLQLHDVRYGLLICYEDILPQFVRKVAQQKPDVLVNLTNDAWFGDSYEPRIHLALGLFRAVEHRRYLLRATNTGISSIIAPTGRIVAHSAVFSRANILGDFVPLREDTPYGICGDLIGYGSAALMLVWSLRQRAHRRALLRLGQRLLGRPLRPGQPASL